MKPAIKKEVVKLSLEQLIELEDEISALVIEKQEEAKADLKAKMEEMAKASGMSLEDILGIKKEPETSRKRKSPKPKYRNPDDPEQTWSGRGRKPRWLAEKLEEDPDLDINEFLIEKPAEDEESTSADE